jgi:hypothetical protein
MRSFIQTAVVITACGSAVFWFASAMCRLSSIRPDMDELHKMTELSNRLQRMSTWKFLGRRTDGRNRYSQCGLDLSDDRRLAPLRIMSR